MDSKGSDSKLMEILKGYSVEEIRKALALIEIQSQKSKDKKSPAPAPPMEFNDLSDALKAKALQVFNAADKDKSGTIDEFELYSLLTEVFGYKLSLPESNVIYYEMDTNHSGTITFEEFYAGLVKYKWDTSKIENRVASTFEWEIPFKEITLEKTLGEGIFGTVYKAKWRGSSVACKKLKNPVVEEIEDFKREVSILGKLRHPNVVLFMGACTADPNNMAIVTELVEGGNLSDVIYVQKKKFDLKTNLSLMKQISFGLNYLHLSNIIHRDLKLPNILVDKFLNVKLCDLGLSCVKNPTKAVSEAVGSPLWRAPEILLRKQYDQSADVYSFALCIWELFSLEQPYLDIEDWDQLVEEVAVKGKRPTVPSFVPSDIAAFIRSSWDADPKKRPNFGQIIAHLERFSSSL